ncbi:hypothetical protein [Enterococcus termitis]|uniref:Uncharacterized protein n=1 Tax=Enterococcus termitis TaxID=332950 RepID=A0A1E5GVP4_9ENTE|nr:hypothetical protein [Enterococcus termitis]OEG16758.1 hypothetical protein BCR25_03955 [Enterococcus termitis]OJG99467.1 hypothetical protein RV18_GL001535 [Enterococcus termitis]
MYSFNQVTHKVALRLGREQAEWERRVAGVVVAGVSIFGVSQILHYYLFTLAGMWLLLFSAGLFFFSCLIPLGAIWVPFMKNSIKEWHFLKRCYWKFIGAYTLLWGVLLLTDMNFIYYFESEYSSNPLKNIGGICLILLSLYVLFTISAKYYLSPKKNKEDNEKSVFDLIMDSFVERYKKWWNNNLYKRNQPLFIAFLPLMVLGLVVIPFCFIDDTIATIIVFMKVVPYLINVLVVVLLRKLWLKRRIPSILVFILSVILCLVWLLVMLFIYLDFSQIANLNVFNGLSLREMETVIDALLLPVNIFALGWTLVYAVRNRRKELAQDVSS